MEEESLLNKQLASARNMLFIIASVTTIAGIFLIPQVIEYRQITDIVVTFSLAVIYLVLAFWTKARPYTAFLTGLTLSLAILIAGVITNAPGLGGHWPSRIIAIGFFFLGLADSKDAQRKMRKQPPPAA
jgi:hypothetical protein